MRIVTANGKKTVKMSKVEWLSIGKKAGWMKLAATPEENKAYDLREVATAISDLNNYMQFLTNPATLDDNKKMYVQKYMQHLAQSLQAPGVGDYLSTVRNDVKILVDWGTKISQWITQPGYAGQGAEPSRMAYITSAVTTMQTSLKNVSSVLTQLINEANNQSAQSTQMKQAPAVAPAQKPV